MARNLGKMAESELQRWAAQVGITANRATEDVEGWDYLLQFPPEQLVAGMPLDLRPSRIESFVQVKGTSTTENRESISLSNWEKLINTPLPAFFLIIVYGGNDSPQKAYLVHVDKQWISKALKRLRAVADGQKASLNRQTLDLTWSEADRLHALDGKSMEFAMRKHIGDFDKYAEEKQRYRKTIGSEAKLKFHITTEKYKTPNEMFEDLVSIAIGQKDSLNLSKLVVEENVRFGIPARRIEHEGGMISFGERPSKPINLVIGNSKETMTSVFPGTLITPDYFFPSKPIPGEHVKVRIQTEICDMVFLPFGENKKFESSFNLVAGEQRYQLGDLANRWRVITIFANAETEGCFFEIRDDQNAPYRATLRQPFPAPEKEVLSIAQSIERAFIVAQSFNIPLTTEVTIPQLLTQDSSIREVRELCDINTPIHSLRGTVILDSHDANKEYAFLFSRIIAFGELKLVVFMGFAGQLTIGNADEEEIPFEIKHPRRVLLESYKLKMIDKEQYDRLVEEQYEKLNNRGYNVIKFSN
ncbi:MAG: hypothetical protein HZB51_27415 [Chloroflexi bacterium]|nr:hypothetical protein [Chloroflexota bacterium]